MQASMIDKNLLIARIKCQMGEIIYQNQINIELDRSNEALGYLLREYNRGYFCTEEIEKFMSKNTEKLSDYKWKEDGLIHNIYVGVSLPPKVNMTMIMKSLENNRPTATMTEESLIKQLKKYADKILWIRSCNDAIRFLIKKKINVLKLDISNY